MFSSFSPLQSSSSWLPLLLWPLPFSILSELYAQHNGPLLSLPIEPGTIAPPCAFTIFLAATL